MNTMRMGLVVACVALACENPTGQPPPRPGIARVELVADSGAAFLGAAVPGRLFVARVVDSAGNAVEDAVVTAEAPPGWRVHGDTVVAPNDEGTGTVKLVARRNAPAASAAREDASTDSTASADVSIGVVVNLDSLHLSVSPVTCRVTPDYRGQVHNDSVFTVDSVTYGLAVDSVVYGGDDPRGTYLIGVYGWAGQLWLSGTAVYYGLGGEAHYKAEGYVALIRQVPDTLTIGAGLNAKTARQGQTRPSYTVDGRPFCFAGTTGMFAADAATLTAK